MASRELRESVLNKVYALLEKPRTSAHSPQALVEVVCAVLSLAYDDIKFYKYMFREYGSTSRPWWLSDDIDFVIATNRLKNLVSYLEEGNFER